MQWLQQLFSTSGFEPYGYCFLWNGRLVTLHVGSDLIIGVSYLWIAATLGYLLYRARETVPFSRVILAFGVFILACGATHFVEILTLWVPVYWFAGALKAVTAVASASTAIILPTLVPRVLGTIRSARAEAAATAALRLSEERFRGTFEHSGIGLAIVGLDGGWQQVNGALARITGYSADELRALTFQDITHPEDLHADLDHLRALLAGDVASYEMEKRYVRKDRSVVHVLLTVSLVRDATRAPLHFVSQIQDLTERRVTQERLQHATKMEAVATLASGIAHDFNNLLTVVRGGADFIRPIRRRLSPCGTMPPRS
jgi:PAS domain S-box-containing protein